MCVSRTDVELKTKTVSERLSETCYDLWCRFVDQKHERRTSPRKKGDETAAMDCRDILDRQKIN